MTTPQNHYEHLHHYEHLLAPHYTWMFGMPFGRKVDEQADLLRCAGVRAPGVAIDLGCGSGFQTLALADLGASEVHALDTSAALLAELRQHARGRPVKTYTADLTSFDQVVSERANTIVCMGDTLTHLASRKAVAALCVKIARCLRPGGRMVLSWRDLSDPPKGLDRFIPVRSDPDRIMTCFLEDHGNTVMVHDLMYFWQNDAWHSDSSAYPKLKLSASWVRQTLSDAMLPPDFETVARGMVIMSARR